MAGAGSRFANAGYKDPKPLIPVHGVPMIKLVIDNLKPSIPHRFIFVCQKSHSEQYNLSERLRLWAPNSVMILLDGLTDGAARTVLNARDFIDNADPLMIANSDQFIDFDVNQYLKTGAAQGVDGQIMTMTASDPKWSFVSKDSKGYISNVVEKLPISDIATVGIYNFTRGSDFVSAASQMILDGEKSNGEYYVAPVYNYLIGQGKKITDFPIGSEGSGFFGLGTPEDLDKFLANSISISAIQAS